MKNYIISLIFILLILSGCKQNNQTNDSGEKKSDIKSTKQLSPQDEIHNLIKKVLIWSDSQDSIDLLPMMTDKEETIYIGIDLEKHRENLDKLMGTGFFSDEFLQNYNDIILAIDQGIKSGYYEKWYVGELPTFNFTNDINPWCMCQDNLDWNNIEILILSLDNEKGEMEWYWGYTDKEKYQEFKEFKYKFKVKKENGSWKISYMQGFNLEEAIKKP